MVRFFSRCLLAILAAAVLLAAAPNQPATTPPMPAVGDIAKDFTLQTPAGKSMKLYDLTAKSPVVLIVLRGWPGYQCPICTKQVGELIAKQKQLEATGVKLVLVYPGPSEYLKGHAEEFIAGKGLPEGFTFLIDPGYTFTDAYGLRWNSPNETAYPSTFVIDTRNTIRFAKISKSHGGRADAATILKAVEKLK